MKQKYPLTLEEFTSIFAKVPRLNIELLFQNESKEILLTKRAIVPCIGEWHIPGGTVWYKESIEKAARRIAEKEVGLQIKSYEIIGFIEYPKLETTFYGDPRGLVLLIKDFSGGVQIDDEASDYGWFSRVPSPILVHQDDFLVEHGLLVRG